MADQNGLKKLNFVPEYGTKGYTIATRTYSAAKDRLPVPVQDQLASLETTVTTMSSPYVAKAQDKGTEILKLVDDQVSLRTRSETAALLLSRLGANTSLAMVPVITLLSHCSLHHSHVFIFLLLAA